MTELSGGVRARSKRAFEAATMCGAGQPPLASPFFLTKVSGASEQERGTGHPLIAATSFGTYGSGEPQTVLLHPLSGPGAQAFDRAMCRQLVYLPVFSMAAFEAEELEQIHRDPHLIQGDVDGAFSDAMEETFEDGMLSQFTSTLIGLVREHGEEALRSIASAMRAPTAGVQVVAEALRWLGAMSDERTAKTRLTILGQYLSHSDLRLRDAAFCGIDAMNTRDAMTILRRAVKKESNPSLRHDMDRLLRLLKTAR